ncbi:MAG: hypothetical protein WBE80_16660 [Methylocella sp.]
MGVAVDAEPGGSLEDALGSSQLRAARLGPFAAVACERGSLRASYAICQVP